MSANLIVKCPVCNEVIRTSETWLDANNNNLICTNCAWEFNVDINDTNLVISKSSDLKPNIKNTNNNKQNVPDIKLKDLPKNQNTAYQQHKSQQNHDLNKKSTNNQQTLPNQKNKKEAKPKISIPNQITDQITQNKNINSKLPNKELYEDLSLPINLIPTNSVSYFVVIWQIVLCILLATTLIMQYVHYNKDKLSYNDSMRSKLEIWCNLVKCKLPLKSDITKLTAEYLTVQNHSKFSDALRISLLLYNEANFNQAFPYIDFKLLDNDGKTVANRTFKPEEYLAGELAGQTIIEANTKVKLRIEIIEPQEEANNYQINFLPNNSL